MIEQLFLKKVEANNINKGDHQIERVLLVYSVEKFFIGDTCMHFDSLKILKKFFPKSSVDISLNEPRVQHMYEALLKNNPFIEKILNLKWSEIDYLKYDLIICATHEEENFLKIISEKIGQKILTGNKKLFIYSIFNFIVSKEKQKKITFPLYNTLYSFSQTAIPEDNTRSLYISKQEQLWADKWFMENGVKQNEEVLIFLDSSTQRSKLLKINVYFEILTNFLKQSQYKVLIFDEKKIGKKMIYKEFLAPEYFSKLIFSEGLEFRSDLSLLSSNFTKLIFGPCTGLLHCASDIFNHISTNKPVNQIPLLITYTGKYPEGQNAYFWWKNCPLVHCLLLKVDESMSRLTTLKEISPNFDLPQVPCSEYTSSMLIDYMSSKLREHTSIN